MIAPHVYPLENSCAGCDGASDSFSGDGSRGGVTSVILLKNGVMNDSSDNRAFNNPALPGCLVFGCRGYHDG